jgi:uncharacterized protein YqeY
MSKEDIIEQLASDKDEMSEKAAELTKQLKAVAKVSKDNSALRNVWRGLKADLTVKNKKINDLDRMTVTLSKQLRTRNEIISSFEKRNRDLLVENRKKYGRQLK